MTTPSWTGGPPMLVVPGVCALREPTLTEYHDDFLWSLLQEDCGPPGAAPHNGAARDARRQVPAVLIGS